MSKQLLVTEGLIIVVIGMMVNIVVTSTLEHVIAILVILGGVALIASTLTRARRKRTWKYNDYYFLFFSMRSRIRLWFCKAIICRSCRFAK